MSPPAYKVLVAEDESLQLSSLVRMVHKATDAFEVVAQAQTGLQALNLAEECLPDVVITDIQMPQMSGIELIEALRDHLPGTRFIIISGYSAFEYAQKAISLRVAAYLLKPVQPEELEEALARLHTELQLQRKSIEDVFNPSMALEPPRRIAEELREYLSGHFMENVNLNLIASGLGYSPSHLTKLFQRYYETPPNRYLTNVRMVKARYCLKYNPELTVRQIGELAGYEDQGYFSRVFKKENGVSPVEYRGATE
jgi:two-component system, response regulator YesN